MIRHRQQKPRDPSRVVVLGASGFVGRQLMAHLAEGGVAAIGPSSADINLEQPEATDRLRTLLQPGDSVVFAAALTPDRGKDTRTLMRNLSMAEHVANALAVSECSHVVYISSDAVYADGVNPIRESSPCAPDTLYGHMHLLREKIIGAAVRCPFAVLRPCALYGTDDTHNSYGPNRFRRTARNDGVIRLFGAGEEKRDHVSVDDFVRLIVLVLAQQSEGLLNVATGTSVSFGTVARQVAEACGREVRIERLPRQGPVTHRHFDVSTLLRAFPTFRFAAFGADEKTATHALPTGVETR